MRRRGELRGLGEAERWKEIKRKEIVSETIVLLFPSITLDEKK